MAAMASQEPLVFPGTRRHGPRSLGRGSIVLLGSTNSLIGAPGVISYGTSKHAVIGIMKSAGKHRLVHYVLYQNETAANMNYCKAVDSLALQSAIRVNTVCPAFVDTPMIQSAIEMNPMVKHAIDNMTPFKRAATVDEVADYIVFLSSPSASFIHGTALAIDAGFTLPAPVLPQ